MKKNLLLPCTAVFLWHSTAFALGLGNATLHSRLGEKLQADIPVIGMGQLVAEDIKVSIASPDTYRKLGIDYEASHQGLAFTLKPNEKNITTIYITSQDSIKEPFLHFALEVSYPNGNMLKDVSLLLDAPQTVP